MAASSTPDENFSSRHKHNAPAPALMMARRSRCHSASARDPVGFFRADDEAGVHAIFLQPLRAERNSLQKRGRIADERTGQRDIFQQRGDVAGRRGINGFGKNQRTGRGRIFQSFVVKPAGVLHAAGLQADDDAEPEIFCGGIGAQSGHGFERGGAA